MAAGSLARDAKGARVNHGCTPINTDDEVVFGVEVVMDFELDVVDNVYVAAFLPLFTFAEALFIYRRP